MRPQTLLTKPGFVPRVIAEVCMTAMGVNRIQPAGKPTENGYIETFNGTLRAASNSFFICLLKLTEYGSDTISKLSTKPRPPVNLLSCAGLQLTGWSFCTTASARVYITAMDCEIGLGGTREL